ncbi:MAG: CdaR family protein [Candidatus Eisenbacteria bacterium]
MKRVSVNVGVRAVAFVIALLVCFNAETERMVDVETDVPIQYINLPDSLVRMGTAPAEVRVRATFNRKFWQTAPTYLSVTLDLSRAKPGLQRFAVTPDLILVPPNRKARVVEIVEPRRIPLEFEPRIRRRVAVAPGFDGFPADGFVLYGEPQVEPPEVVLAGPESVVESIEEVVSVTVDLTGAREDVAIDRMVDLTGHDQVTSEPPEVQVLFDIERIEDRILQKRPIRTAPSYRIEVEPDSLDVVVRGPAAVLAEIRESRTRLYLDVSLLPVGEHPYITEVVEGNLIHFFPRQPTVDLASPGSKGGGALPSPELEGEVQNLPDLVVLVDSSPKVFTIRRKGL